MGQAQHPDAFGQTVLAAAERFCTSHNVGLTSKRLLYELLAFVGPNGCTLSGSGAPGTADVVSIVRKFVSFHLMKHYYVMRQFDEVTSVVLDFLQFLRKDSSLPADMSAQLDTAIEVAKQSQIEAPHIFRIMRQPDVLNEAYSFRYQSRPWPLCHVPATTECKESSSRFWPANNEQHIHAWVSFASERCRVEPDELLEVLNQVPTNLSMVAKTDGIWEVMEVRPDSKILFKQWRGSKQFTVQFSAKRAADFLPGMVMCATFVTLSDNTHFITDWGYTFPSFYAPYLTGPDDFGCYDRADLVY